MIRVGAKNYHFICKSMWLLGELICSLLQALWDICKKPLSIPQRIKLKVYEGSAINSNFFKVVFIITGFYYGYSHRMLPVKV